MIHNRHIVEDSGDDDLFVGGDICPADSVGRVEAPRLCAADLDETGSPVSAQFPGQVFAVAYSIPGGNENAQIRVFSEASASLSVFVNAFTEERSQGVFVSG